MAKINLKRTILAEFLEILVLIMAVALGVLAGQLFNFQNILRDFPISLFAFILIIIMLKILAITARNKQ